MEWKVSYESAPLPKPEEHSSDSFLVAVVGFVLFVFHKLCQLCYPLQPLLTCWTESCLGLKAT